MWFFGSWGLLEHRGLRINSTWGGWRISDILTEAHTGKLSSRVGNRTKMAGIIPQLLVVTVVLLNFYHSADSYCGLENCSLLAHFTKHDPHNSLRSSGGEPPSQRGAQFLTGVLFLLCSGESSGDQVQPCQLLLKVREVQGSVSSWSPLNKERAQLKWTAGTGEDWAERCAMLSFQRFLTLIATFWFLQINSSKLA